MLQPRGEARRILVVDDEPGIRQVVSNMLTRSRFSVTTASDVAAATRALQCARFAALLTDLGLPDRPGIVLVDEVERYLDATPVVLMSGSFANLDPTDRRVDRVAGLLTKPLDAKTLCTLVRSVVNIAPSRPTPRHRGAQR